MSPLLSDPVWHVSSRSGVATLRTAIHLLLTYLLTYYTFSSRIQQIVDALTSSWSSRPQRSNGSSGRQRPVATFHTSTPHHLAYLYPRYVDSAMWCLMNTSRQSRATATQLTGPRYVTTAASDCRRSVGQLCTDQPASQSVSRSVNPLDAVEILSAEIAAVRNRSDQQINAQQMKYDFNTHTHTHTHTRLAAVCPGLHR